MQVSSFGSAKIGGRRGRDKERPPHRQQTCMSLPRRLSSYPLARRLRGLARVAAVSRAARVGRAPAEMFRVSHVFKATAQHRAQFGAAFLTPNFQDWDTLTNPSPTWCVTGGSRDLGATRSPSCLRNSVFDSGPHPPFPAMEQYFQGRKSRTSPVRRLMDGPCPLPAPSTRRLFALMCRGGGRPFVPFAREWPVFGCQPRRHLQSVLLKSFGGRSIRGAGRERHSAPTARAGCSEWCICVRAVQVLRCGAHSRSNRTVRNQPTSASATERLGNGRRPAASVL